jgi:hypothetical protein
MQPAAVTPELRAQLQEKRREIAVAKESADRVAAHLATLERSPNDPAANLAAGRHFCLVAHDWERGIPYLAKGSDAALKAAATRELAGASTADAAVGVGDGWWDLAALQSDRAARAEMLAHAADVYSGAIDRLSGLRKTQIEKRIADARSGAALPSRTKAAKPIELLAAMNGKVSGRGRDGVILKTRDRITTPEKFKPPVAFRIVTQTAGVDFRMSYAADQIIFSWANIPSELRIDGGPANGRHKPGGGDVPKNKWVTIDLVVLPTTMTVSVDGEERQKVYADFSNINQSFSIWPSFSPLMIKSIQMTTPPKE